MVDGGGGAGGTGVSKDLVGRAKSFNLNQFSHVSEMGTHF